MRAWIIGLASLAAIVVAGVVFWPKPDPDVGRPTADTRPTPATPASFVGRDACLSCHTDQVERWTDSYHDRAMQPADAQTVRGDFSAASHRYAGFTSRFSTRDDQFVAITEGPDGEPHDYEIAYTFGDYPLQQYLVAFPGGRYQALSISWDARPRAEGGQRWFHLYPDERVRAGDVLHWTQPSQNWNRQCAECHSTNLRKGYVAAEDRYDTTWSELNVSCEACHGPGSRHVEWADSGTPDDAGTLKGFAFDLDGRSAAQWVMNPETGIASRDRPRQATAEIEMCARCHSRRGVLTDAYVHGRPLADTHRPALLDEGLYFADGQIQDEVYVYGSFLQSRMYAAGVTCSDCHDPHSLEVGQSPDEVCARCHLPSRFASPEHHRHQPGSSGASCVACHMPERTYMVVDPRRDHSFRVPRPDLALSLGTPDPCTACHADRGAAWAATHVAAWDGTVAATPHFGPVLDEGRRMTATAERRLRDLTTDTTVPAIARATAVALLAPVLSSLSLPAVEAATGDDDSLVRMAAAETLAAADEATRARLLAPLFSDPIRLVRIAAGRTAAGLHQNLLTPSQREARDRALQEWVAVQEEQADTPGARLNLGTLYVERGETAKAREEYEAALRLQPAFIPASVNLADLHRSQGREQDAERVLRRGLELVPDDPALHHALGLLQVRTGREQEAIGSLGRARELAPDNPRYAYVLAVAWASAGRQADAIALLRRTHEEHAGNREVLGALIAYLRQTGQTNAALGYARLLAELSPFDEGVKQLVMQLEAERR